VGAVPIGLWGVIYPKRFALHVNIYVPSW